MKINMNKKATRGISLLEVLVSVSIAGFILAICIPFISKITKQWNIKLEHSRTERKVIRLFDVIERDFLDGVTGLVVMQEGFTFFNKSEEKIAYYMALGKNEEKMIVRDLAGHKEVLFSGLIDIQCSLSLLDENILPSCLTVTLTTFPRKSFFYNSFLQGKNSTAKYGVQYKRNIFL